MACRLSMHVLRRAGLPGPNGERAVHSCAVRGGGGGQGCAAQGTDLGTNQPRTTCVSGSLDVLWVVHALVCGAVQDGNAQVIACVHSQHAAQFLRFLWRQGVQVLAEGVLRRRLGAVGTILGVVVLQKSVCLELGRAGVRPGVGRVGVCLAGIVHFLRLVESGGQ